MTRSAVLAMTLVLASLGAAGAAPRYDVRQFKAAGDKTTNDTAAIQAAIDACAGGGGGTVAFPPGDYTSGGLRLRSGVHLHLEAGATLWSSRNAADYDKDRRYLLTAEGAHDVAISGKGTIRGIGESDLGRRADKSDTARPAFRAGILRLDKCKNVEIRDLTILYSDTWTLNLRECEDVVIDGVAIRNNYFRVNSDGIDPVSCRNVRISNCHVVAGDDCIVVKTSGGKPCENVVVSHCTLETIATAIKLGTESSGEFRDIRFEHCTIRNSSVGIGLFMKDGGAMERIQFSDINLENYTPRGKANVDHSVFPIFLDIEKRHETSPVGRIRDVTFESIRIRSSVNGLIQGMPGGPIENLTLRDIRFQVVEPIDFSQRRKRAGGRRSTKDTRDTLYVRQPAWIVAAHVRGLVVDGLEVTVPDEVFRRFERSAFLGVELDDAQIGRVVRRPAGGQSPPAVVLQECRSTEVKD